MSKTGPRNTPVLSDKPRPVAGERFSDGELGEIMKGFAERLVDAFEGANDNEIARQCQTTHATIREYTSGRRLPIAEMLIHISRTKGINIHWLLTGRGHKWATPVVELFDEEEERQIRELAKSAGRTFEEQVRAMVTAVLDLGKKV